jgi:glycerol-3-phosphate dehydrogenase
VDVKDALTGETHQLKTKYLINGAGPWFEECCSLKKPIKHSRQNWAMALNIVSRKKIFEKYAVALEGKRSYLDKDAVVKRDKRLYFFVPWQDHTMIGTEYEACRDNPDIFKVKRESIQNMVNEVNAIYPAANLSYGDISFYHAGLVPMQNNGEGDGIQLEKNSLFFFHEEAGYERVVSIKGVKYTTAPHIARQIVAELFRKMELKTGRTASLEESFNAVNRHSFGREEVDEHNFQAEIREMIENEMVCHLTDIIFRRTDLGSAECPDMALLQKITNAMAGLLGWNSSQKQEEIEEVLKRYEPLADRNS